MKLSEKISLLRKEKGWSQEQLASKLDVSRQAIYKWEADIATPEIEKLKKLSIIFNISLDNLLNDDLPLSSNSNLQEKTIEQEPVMSEESNDEEKQNSFQNSNPYDLNSKKGNKLPLIIFSILGALVIIAALVVGAVLLFGKHTHEFGDYVISDEETCTSEGSKYRVCEKCDYKEVASIPKSKHNYIILNSVEATCTETGFTMGKKCSDCDDILVQQTIVPAKGHKEIIVKGQESTCIETGLTDGKKCSVCNETLLEQQITKKKDHIEATIIGTSATCTEEGLTDGKKCSVCNTVLLEQQIINAKGHTPEIVNGKEATCKEEGLTDGKKCSVCKETLEEQVKIPKSSHKYDDNKDAECNACGYVRDVNCKHINTAILPAVSPSCTKTGLTQGEKCVDCEEITIKQQIIEKTDHTEETVLGKEPTCEETGLTNGKKCSVCDTVLLEQQVISAKGHTEVVVQGQEATCTQTGLTDGKKCSVCGKTTVNQTTILKKDHTEETVLGKEPTCEEKGLTDGKKCSVCDTVLLEQQVISANGHTEVIVQGQEATCTQTGLTDGKKCTVCQTITVPQETINAKGHTEQNVAGYSATCIVAGLTDGKKCSVCNETLLEQNIINPYGHHFVNSACDKCGFSLGASVGLEYSLNESTNTYTVTGIGNCQDTDIVIPEAYEGLAVTTIGESAFEDCYFVEYISIPDSVTSIERLAFSGCTALENITLSNNLKQLDSAFGGCKSLNYNKFGNSYYLGSSTNSYYALIRAENTDITSCTINEDTKVLVNSAFEYCRKLTEINYNAVSIYDLNDYNRVFNYAGESNTGITVNIGKNVKEIPSKLFDPGNSGSCDEPKIVSVVFEEGSQCKRIGKQAFACSYDIATVSYNDGIAGWLSIEFESGDSNPLAYDNSELYINGQKLLKLVLPDEITEIKPRAFYGYHKLLSVTLHQNVTNIGEYAFGDDLYGCAQLVEIYNLSELSLTSGAKDNGCIALNAKVIHNSIENESIISIVDDYVFLNESGNYSLLDYIGNETEITLPQDYNGYSYAIAKYGFYRSKLKKIVISSGVTSIGDYAIWVCPNLQSITIGENVTDMGEFAFGSCENLTEIYFNATSLNSCTSLNFNAAGRMANGIKLTIGKNVTKLPENLFGSSSTNNYRKITSVVFEEGSVCQSIGKYVFQNCATLTSITIPISVKIIDFRAFDGCTSLTVYCEATKQPAGWNSNWSDDLKAVYWYTNDTPTESGNYWYYGANGKIITISVQ